MSVLAGRRNLGRYGRKTLKLGSVLVGLMCGSCVRIPGLELSESYFYTPEKKIPINREKDEKFIVEARGEFVGVNIELFPPDSEEFRVMYVESKGRDTKVEIDHEKTYFLIDGKERKLLDLSWNPTLRGGYKWFWRSFNIVDPVPLREFEDKREGWRGGLDDHNYRMHVEFTVDGVRYIADVKYSFDFDYRLDIGVPGGTP